MPTNLPPEYYEVQERLKAAGSVEEKIACMEELLTKIPKHKGTDKLRGSLRQKISKLKTIPEAKSKTGKHDSVYHVDREGPARVLVLGAPNVGKSALVAAVTHATPKVSEYPFTTWIPVPGMMPVFDIQIQLIDTPALSREHVEPDFFNLIRVADFILLVVDLQGHSIQQLDDCIEMLDEHHITLQGGNKKSSGFAGHVSIPCIILANKTDDETWDEEYAVFEELLDDRWPLLSISAKMGRNLDEFRQIIFDRLEIMRIYSKQPRKEADLTAPFVLKKGSTIEVFAASVHKDFIENLKTARVWGTDVHDGQMVGRDHVLYDGDIVELHT